MTKQDVMVLSILMTVVGGLLFTLGFAVGRDCPKEEVLRDLRLQLYADEVKRAQQAVDHAIAETRKEFIHQHTPVFVAVDGPVMKPWCNRCGEVLDEHP